MHYISIWAECTKNLFDLDFEISSDIYVSVYLNACVHIQNVNNIASMSSLLGKTSLCARNSKFCTNICAYMSAHFWFFQVNSLFRVRKIESSSVLCFSRHSYCVLYFDRNLWAFHLHLKTAATTTLHTYDYII